MPWMSVRVVPEAATRAPICDVRSAIWRFSSRMCRTRPRATLARAPVSPQSSRITRVRALSEVMALMVRW